MPSNALDLDEINRKTRELAEAIEESVADLAAQISSLKDRYSSLTDADIATVEVTGGDGGRRVVVDR